MTEKGKPIQHLIDDILNWASSPEEGERPEGMPGSDAPFLEIVENLAECVALGALDSETPLLERQAQIAERVKKVRDIIHAVRRK